MSQVEEHNRLDPYAIPAGHSIGGRYQVQEQIGRGGGGAVYLCRDRLLGRTLVAVKIIFPEGLSAKNGKELLAQEITAANRVNHDNVIRFYDYHDFGDFNAVVMEYVDGIPLSQVIHPKELLPYSFVVDVLRQTCLALKAIHAEGIIHRDLKPANIILSKDGLIKLTDFGIAAVASVIDRKAAGLPTHRLALESPTGTSDSHVIGTSEYISPEYLMHNVYSERSDIYALGVIAYELITGKFIFESENLAMLLEYKMEYDPVPPNVLRPDCPRELNDFCVTALQRNPDNRYQSAEDCLFSLRRIVVPQGSVFEISEHAKMHSKETQQISTPLTFYPTKSLSKEIRRWRLFKPRPPMTWRQRAIRKLIIEAALLSAITAALVLGVLTLLFG